MKHQSPTHSANFYLILILVFGSWFVSPASAALINPTAAPPGGQAARPLKATDVTQSKLGSLILGAQSSNCNGVNTSTCARLCLNATSTDDTERCITNWNIDLKGSISQSVVRVWRTPAYTINAALANLQTGYVRIKGDAANAFPTTTAFPIPWGSQWNPGSIYSGLVADSVDSDNYAGVFKGDVGIESTLFNSPGLLCLNSTCGLGSTDPVCTTAITGDIPKGFYCISKWSDLVLKNTPTNQLTGQSLDTSPLTELGNVALTQAFSSGSLVLGDPDVMDPLITCGDGMCSSQESTIGSCPVDCEQIPVPTSATAVPTTPPDSVTLTIKRDVLPDSGTMPGVLVVRSTVKNFTFQPQNGVSYIKGGTTALAIVQAGPCGFITCIIYDTSFGMVTGTSYYYRVWLMNDYPRYSSFITERQATSPGGPPGGLPNLLFPVP